jgi:hypothetical protein
LTAYVCTACSEHFTRKFSGQRHNFNIHSGRSEIVPYIEYMAGRSSGQYLTSHPSQAETTSSKSQPPTIQQKIEELKLLLGKFSSPQNAHTILELAKYNLIQGDEQFLNERLEQLRMLDRPQVRRLV